MIKSNHNLHRIPNVHANPKHGSHPNPHYNLNPSLNLKPNPLNQFNLAVTLIVIHLTGAVINPWIRFD